MSEEIICFYHANCVDGAASAAVIHKKYPEALCVPMSHGDPILDSVEGKKVFIVDFSFDAVTLKKLKNEAKEVCWYDHHKTSIPTHEALGCGVLNAGGS